MSDRVWEIVNLAMQTSTPIILWGEPGVGKTEIIKQMAAANGYHVETVIASTRQPSDLVGLPIAGEDGVKFAPPEWAVRANQHEKAIVFFDELSTAPPSVQAAVLRIFSEKMVDSFQLGPNVSLMAAANPVECSAGGWELAAPMANRLMHLSVKPDVDSWVKWMMNGGEQNNTNWAKIPKDWERHCIETRTLFASYMQVKRNDLQNLPKGNKASDAGGPWASPRTWHMASKIMGAVQAVSGDLDLQHMAVAACVGGPNAQNFFTWKKSLDLPKPEDVLKDVAKFMPEKVLKRADLLYTILSSVVSYTLSFKEGRDYEKHWYKAVEVIEYVKNQGYKDVALVFLSPLMQKGNRIEGMKKVPNIVKELCEFIDKASQTA